MRSGSEEWKSPNVFFPKIVLMFCDVWATKLQRALRGCSDIAKHKQNLRKKDVRDFLSFGTAADFSENLMLFGVKITQKAHSSIKVDSDLSFKAETVAFREAKHEIDRN